MDNDVEVPKGWWGGLFAHFAHDPRVGIVAPRKVYGDSTLQNVGNRLRLDGGTYPCLLERSRVVPDYVEGACMVMRPEVWQSVRWETAFPIFYEDVDACFQAREQGFEVVATVDVTLRHHAHTTSGERVGESERNRLGFLQKWKERI